MANKKTDKMQQLIKSDNSIIRELRDQKWIYNPKVYAQVAGDFSLMHQRVLMGVLEKLQDRIIHSASEHQKNQQLWLPLFAPEETDTSVDFEIEARDLGVTPAHYQELAQALTDLVSMKIGYPKKKGNKTVYVVATLFSRIEMPTSANGWRTGKIRVKMDKENVNDFLSMDRGYTDHIARIAQFSKKQRTPRIYIYLSTFKYKGRNEVEYPELCEFLGIDDATYVANHKAEKPDVKPSDNPFHKFSKVKKLILDPSKAEMDKFSEERKIDFSFTYEPLYKDGRKKGNPTHIGFVIVPGALGIERLQERKRHNQIQALINAFTRQWPDLAAYDLLEVSKDVQDDWLDDFCNYAYDDVRRQVEKTQPDHVPEYVLTLLRTWIKNKTNEARRLEVERKRQHDMFVQQKAESLWRSLMQELAAQTPLRARQINLESYDDTTKTLTVALAGKEIFDQLEPTTDENGTIVSKGIYQDIWFALVRKYYPAIKIQYRMG